MKKPILAMTLASAIALGACAQTPPPEPPPPPPPPPGAITGSVAADTNGDGIVDGYYTSDGVYHANPLPPPPPPPPLPPPPPPSRSGERG